MVMKRKHDSNSTEASEPPQKQQQQEASVEADLTSQNQPTIEGGLQEIYKEVKIEVEEEEEEDEEEEEEEEEAEEEEEGKQDEEDPNSVNQKSKDVSILSNLESSDDDEPIQNLLEPFSKERLVILLCQAAESHRDVADRIRELADEDPSHRKIFVHGLGWDTTVDSLKNSFQQYGEIEDCKAVCDKVSGKSKGYGFILFKTRKGAREALKEPQKKIGNRMAACQLASIGPGPGPAPTPAAPVVQVQQPVSEYTSRKIYVSNVAAELDPQKLYELFSKYGEIEEGPLGLDKVTGKPKGFCLFVYKTSESAKKSLEDPHKNFEGNILHCQRAIDGPKPNKGGYRQQQNPHFPRNNNNHGFTGGAGGAHIMAPGSGIGFGQGGAAQQALNPAVGQALTALLATQGAGLGLNNLLGALGSAAGMTQSGPAGATGLHAMYGNQAGVNPAVMGGYINQTGMQGAYPNQQIGQGGAGRGQHGVGQYGAGPYIGH